MNLIFPYFCCVNFTEIFFVYIIFICSKLWGHPKWVFYLFKHQIIIFTSFSEKFAIKKVIVLSNLISFESIDSTTCVCSSFFFSWNDFSAFFFFQWIKTRSISEAAAFCYGNRLNGNLYLTSIEGPVRMTYAIILFPPGAKKQYLSLRDFAKKTLKITIFSPRCSNFIYSFSQHSFLFLRSFSKNLKIGNLNCTL